MWTAELIHQNLAASLESLTSRLYPYDKVVAMITDRPPLASRNRLVIAAVTPHWLDARSLIMPVDPLSDGSESPTSGYPWLLWLLASVTIADSFGIADSVVYSSRPRILGIPWLPWLPGIAHLIVLSISPEWPRTVLAYPYASVGHRGFPWFADARILIVLGICQLLSVSPRKSRLTSSCSSKSWFADHDCFRFRPESPVACVLGGRSSFRCSMRSVPICWNHWCFGFAGRSWLLVARSPVALSCWGRGILDRLFHGRSPCHQPGSWLRRFFLESPSCFRFRSESAGFPVVAPAILPSRDPDCFQISRNRASCLAVPPGIARLPSCSSISPPSPESTVTSLVCWNPGAFGSPAGIAGQLIPADPDFAGIASPVVWQIHWFRRNPGACWFRIPESPDCWFRQVARLPVVPRPILISWNPLDQFRIVRANPLISPRIRLLTRFRPESPDFPVSSGASLARRQESTDFLGCFSESWLLISLESPGIPDLPWLLSESLVGWFRPGPWLPVVPQQILEFRSGIARLLGCPGDPDCPWFRLGILTVADCSANPDSPRNPWLPWFHWDRPSCCDFAWNHWLPDCSLASLSPSESWFQRFFRNPDCTRNRQLPWFRPESLTCSCSDDPWFRSESPVALICLESHDCFRFLGILDFSCSRRYVAIGQESWLLWFPPGSLDCLISPGNRRLLCFAGIAGFRLLQHRPSLGILAAGCWNPMIAGFARNRRLTVVPQRQPSPESWFTDFMGSRVADFARSPTSRLFSISPIARNPDFTQVAGRSWLRSFAGITWLPDCSQQILISPESPGLQLLANPVRRNPDCWFRRILSCTEFRRLGSRWANPGSPESRDFSCSRQILISPDPWLLSVSPDPLTSGWFSASPTRRRDPDRLVCWRSLIAFEFRNRLESLTSPGLLESWLLISPGIARLPVVHSKSWFAGSPTSRGCFQESWLLISRNPPTWLFQPSWLFAGITDCFDFAGIMIAGFAESPGCSCSPSLAHRESWLLICTGITPVAFSFAGIARLSVVPLICIAIAGSCCCFWPDGVASCLSLAGILIAGSPRNHDFPVVPAVHWFRQESPTSGLFGQIPVRPESPIALISPGSQLIAWFRQVADFSCSANRLRSRNPELAWLHSESLDCWVSRRSPA